MTFSIEMISEWARTSLLVLSIFLPASIGLLWMTGNLGKLLRSFLGDMSQDELKKFSLLSLSFGVIILSYWMMRTLKDGVFFSLVGKQYQPVAKMLTPIILAIVLVFYSKMVDSVRKHRLFLIVCTFYAAIFATVGLVWKCGIPAVSHPLIDWIPGHIIGWVYYWAVETFGGIIIGGIFWGFVASSTKTESAKKGYPLIFVGAQIGNFFGPGINLAYAPQLGTINLILLNALIVLAIPLFIEFYMRVVPAYLHESDDAGVPRKKTSALEGIRLIATKPYLIGVAVVSTVYEVVGTIIDYQFKVISADYFTTAAGTFDNNLFNAFMSFYGMAAAFLAILFSLMGTSFFIRRFGVKGSLLGYPLMVGMTVIALWIKPVLAGFFVGMMAVKAFSYALNSPVKELLYLPTSKDVKFKAKAVIDGFGGKSAKSFGAMITSMFAKDPSRLINMGGLISLGIVGGWLLVAMVLGTQYNELIEKKEIVE